MFRKGFIPSRGIVLNVLLSSIVNYSFMSYKLIECGGKPFKILTMQFYDSVVPIRHDNALIVREFERRRRKML